MYTNVLTAIRNAQAARKRSVKVPFSNMDMAILELLSKHGYVGETQKRGRMPKRMIEVKLVYAEDKGVINGVKFISKPSRRIYAGYKDLHRVKHGYGLRVLTTPKGMRTGEEARKEKVGGQVLFEIW